MFHRRQSEPRRRSARHDCFCHGDADGVGGTLAAQGIRRIRPALAGIFPERRGGNLGAGRYGADAGATDELRRGIAAWHSRNPLPESLVAARALGFASQIAEAGKDEKTKPGSVFSLLGVDPLAGMDPAVREIAQTRLFAERALFVTQKMPMLLRWQTELLSVNAVEMPAVQQLVSNSTQIAASVERFAARRRASCPAKSAPSARKSSRRSRRRKKMCHVTHCRQERRCPLP